MECVAKWGEGRGGFGVVWGKYLGFGGGDHGES